MQKKKLVLAITNESYLWPLEMKIAFEYADNVALEVISSKEYFYQYFLQPRSIDILVIEEELYDSSFYRHDIKRIVVLSERIPYVTENGSEKYVFKYSNIKILLNTILPDIQSEKNTAAKKQLLIVTMSAVGGSGCTTASLGLALYLAQSYKKVLFINGQSIQTFNYLLKTSDTLSLRETAAFRSRKSTYSELKPCFCNASFDYLPQLPTSRQCMGITGAAYSDLAIEAKNTSEYDFVIIDIGTECASEEAKALEAADKVLVFTNQDGYSAKKTSDLLKIIQCSDSEKYIFVCSLFDSTKPNQYASSTQSSNEILINEYIEKTDQSEDITVISQLKGIQRIAVSLL